MKDLLQYRPNVAAIVLSSKYPEKIEYFIAKRKGARRSWQFPQGGIDKGETPQEALLRELKEEIGTNKVEIIAEYPEWIKYDFPKNSKNNFYPFKGQNQKFFLVKLLDDEAINLNSFITPEFDEYLFVSEEELFKKAFYLKRKAYKQVIEYFKKEGFLKC